MLNCTAHCPSHGQHYSYKEERPAVWVTASFPYKLSKACAEIQVQLYILKVLVNIIYYLQWLSPFIFSLLYCSIKVTSKVQIIISSHSHIKNTLHELFRKNTLSIIFTKYLLFNVLAVSLSWHHVTPSAWISLTLSCHPPHRPLLLAGLQGSIPYWQRATVCSFEQVILPLLIHVKESTGVYHLWARPYFFSSVPHVWLI